MNAKLKEMRLPPQKPKVNQVQRRYLQDRLNKAARDKKDSEDEKMPADLQAAQKRIEAWNRAQWAKANKQRIRISEARKKVEELILFSTPEEALAAVEAFERLKVE